MQTFKEIFIKEATNLKPIKNKGLSIKIHSGAMQNVLMDLLKAEFGDIFIPVSTGITPNGMFFQIDIKPGKESLFDEVSKFINNDSRFIKASKGETVNEANEEEDKLTFADFDLDSAVKNLEKEITRLIGIPVKFTYKIERDRFVKFSSQDLAGPMKPRMFKKLNVVNWGGEINKDGHIWLNIKYEYEHIEGGSNGCDIAQIWIDKTGNVIEKRTKF